MSVTVSGWSGAPFSREEPGSRRRTPADPLPRGRADGPLVLPVVLRLGRKWQVRNVDVLKSLALNRDGTNAGPRRAA